MKNIKTNLLLDQLKSETRQIILETKRLLQQDPGLLIQQPAPGKWSVAQTIEHLNAYGRYYLPAIGKAMETNSFAPAALYSGGWLGNFFTKSIKPSAGGEIKNKMKAMKSYTPSPDQDSKSVIDEYLQQQQTILALLEKAGAANLSRIRVAISLAPFIKLKLGDTFRFVIAHEQRHMIQCANTLASLSGLSQSLPLPSAC